MKLIDCIKMAFSDLNRRKLRTALTSFGIAIGTILVILMSGLGQGIQTVATDQLKQADTFRIITVKPQHKVNSTTVTDKKIDAAMLNKLKNINGVSKVLASIDTTAPKVSLNNNSVTKVDVRGFNLNFPIISDAEKNQLKSNKKKVQKYGSNEIIAGKIINNSDDSSVLVGQDLLKKLGIKDYKSIVGKNITVTISLPSIDGLSSKTPLVLNLKVSGIVNKAYSLGSNTITASDKVAAQIQEYYMGSSDYINQKGYDDVSVECKTIPDVTNVNSSITKIGYVTQSSQSSANTINMVIVILKVLLTAAGVIVLLVASIGVVNTMSMAVHEKIKTIGIMKAEGASKKNIRRMFIVQSGSLGFVGSAFGSVIALIATAIINKLLIAYNVIQVDGASGPISLIEVKPSTVILTIVFTVLISMLAGVLPARKAAKLNPVDSLSCE
ncbi:MAG: FtsX-like permease family protein [Clostridium sp.]|nr:FtsX-like permease family protein [Clostridium sp.]